MNLNFNHFAYKRRSGKILGSSRASRTSESCINGFTTEDRNILSTRNANRKPDIVSEDERGCFVPSDLPSSSKECIYVSSDSDLEKEMNKPISSVNDSSESDSEDIVNEIEEKRSCVDNASDLSKKNSDIDNEKSPESLEFECKMNKLKQLFPKAKEKRLKSFINQNYDLPTLIHILSWIYNGNEEKIQESAKSEFLNGLSPFMPGKRVASDDNCIEVDQPRKKIKSIDEPTQKDSSKESINSDFASVNNSVDMTERKALKKLKLIFPDRDEQNLLEVFRSTGTVRNVISKLCGSPKKTSHRRRKDSEESDSGDEKVTPYQRVKILSFLEEASVAEISCVPGCSVKKAERIAKLRPFGDWTTMVKMLDSAKGLSSQIAFDCLNLVEEREQISALMARCERISKNILKLLSSRMETSSNVQSNDKFKSVNGVDGIGDGGCSDGPADHGDDDDDGVDDDDEVVMLSPTKVKLDVPSVSVVSQPRLLSERLQLKPYQMTGLNWLVLMHEQKMNGILADEMGLGKTVQTISFLAHLEEHGEQGPHIVVVPASTFDNWVREFKQWLPSFKCIQYYGSIEERARLKEQLLYNEIEFDVVITTYHMATSSPSDRHFFRKLNCHYVVFDEAHMLKNMQSQRYSYLMNFKARRRLLLTGTPLQNNILELMSLLSFVMPSMFGAHLEGIKMLFSNKSGSATDNKFEKEKVAQVKRIMKPFVLRRLKKDVLMQLPTKHENVVRCELTNRQRTMYDDLFLHCSKEYKKKVGKKCENLLMMLRKMANHPLLCRNEYNDEKLWEMARLYCKDIRHRDSKPDLVHEDMTVMSDFELHKLCLEEEKLAPFALDTRLILDCGKFTYLDRVLPNMKQKGDRVLLFSQFTMVMDILEVYLQMRGHLFLRLDGSTPVVERQTLIDRFNSDSEIFVFLLSTKAGGLGINLTSANVVIIHDIDFNPYNDKQAEDRCHRVGQTSEVNVYKIISENTVEEAMLTCAEQKLRLEQDIAAKDQNSMENSKDVLMLLNEVFKGKRDHD